MRYPIALLSIAIISLVATRTLSCPFCSAVSQTFTEEIDAMDVVVIGRLIDAPPVPDAATNPDAPLPKAKFQIEKIIKGEQFVKPDQEVEVLYFGEPNKDKRYLMMATDPPQLMWSTPLGLTERAHQYILALSTLPTDGSRLLFFQEHLEDEDEMLSRDSYDEFANASYADLIAMKDKMHHEKLIAWIQNPDVPATRRRLYFTMLGVCGTEKDAPLLKQMMESSDRKDKAGLDAMIACYLLLTKEPGLELVDELFLKNSKSEYADTYAAIMAIRFHGTETDVIEQTRLVESLRYMLDRPELADLVIPDLARWKDWDAMPRLVELFKKADEKSSWVRVPVINFLRACPLPEAKQQIEELSEIDPDAVKRAQTFFPFDAAGDGEKTKTDDNSNDTTGVATRAEAELARNAPAAQPTPPADQPTPLAQPTPPELTEQEAGDVAVSGQPATTATPSQPLAATDEPLVATSITKNEATSRSKTEKESKDDRWRPNRFQLWGVPMLAGIGLLFAYRIVLGLPLIRFNR